MPQVKTFSERRLIYSAFFLIFLAAGLILFSPQSAEATVSETTAPADMTVSTQTIKVSSDDTPVIRFRLTGDDVADEVTQVSIIISDVGSSGTTSSDFDAVKVYKSSDNNLDSGDSAVGTQTAINIGSATDISVSDTIGESASWYIATVGASAAATANHQFVVTMAADAITATDLASSTALSTANTLTIASGQDPIFSSFTPASVNVGDTITITGANFTATDSANDAVIFAGGPAGDITADVNSWSWNSINVTVPTYAQTGTIQVRVNSTTAIKTGLIVEPKVTSASASTSSVTVNFDNYMDGMYATAYANYTLASPIGGSEVDLSSTWMDFRGNQMTIRNISLTAGASFSITVNANVASIPGTAVDSAFRTATGSIANAPTITSVSPSTGDVGDTLTIAGTNFGSSQGTSRVYFSPGPPVSGAPQEPIAGTSYPSWSATQIEVVVPSGAKSGSIFVRVNGIESSFSSGAFFDIQGNYQCRIQDSESSNIGATNARLVIGGMSGPTLYYVGDSNSTSYASGTGIFTIPNVSSDGHVWAFDASGNNITGSGTQIDTTQVQTFTLSSSARKISGSIAGAGANREIAVWSDPMEETGTNMEWREPVFVKTNGSGAADFNVGVGAAGQYRVGVEDPGFKTGTSSSQKIAPSSQTVDATSANVTGLSFSFAAAAARIHGLIQKAEGKTFASGPGNDIFHVFAYEPKENGFHASAVPDSNGEFDLYVNPVEAGDSGVHTYIVEVGGPGVPFMVQETIEVSNDDSAFALTDSTTDVTLKIKSPEDYVSGTVTDSEGNGVSGASVFAWSETGPGGGEAFSNSSGVYTLYLSPGTYSLEGFAPNYGKLTRRTGIVVSTSSHPTVDFSVSSEMATITGTVTKGGSNLANADVWVTEEEFGWGINGSRTNSSGVYTLRVPYTPSGTTYYLHIATAGKGELYRAAISTTLDKDTTSLTQNVTLTTATITVKISPKTSFSQAFVGIHGTGTTKGGGFSETDVSAASDAFRQYTIEVARPSSGSYTYRVEGGIPNYGPLPAAMTVDGTSQSNHDITITSSTSTMTIEFTLGSVYTISGSIADPNTGTSGNEASEAWVWAASPSGHGGGEVDSSGNFSFKVPAGTYDIGVDKDGYIGIMLNDADVTSGNYSVASGALTLTRSTSTIAGTATGSAGAISEAWIWANNGSGGWAGSQTNGDGEFTLNVGSGDWNVKGIAEGYSESSSSTVSAGTSGLTITLSAISGYTASAPKVEPITPQSGGIVQGTNARVDAPAGALGTDSSSGWLTIEETTSLPTTNSFKPLANKGKSIIAQDSTNTRITDLDAEITIELTYDASDLTTAEITQAQGLNLSLGYWNTLTNSWTTIPTSAVSDSDGTGVIYTGTTRHLSDFAPLIPSGGDPPDTPTDLSITVFDQRLRVNWTASSGATKYYVYRKSGATYPYLGQTTNMSYSDENLTNGTTYYYKVTALNADNDESAATSVISAVPQVIPSGGDSPVVTAPVVVEEEAAEEEVVEEGGGAAPPTTPPAEEEEEVSLEGITIPALEKSVAEMTIEELQAKIDEFMAAVQQLQNLLARLTGVPGIPADYKFEKNLKYMDRSDDVKYLQIFLNSDPETQLAESGPGSPGKETTLLGPLTKAAVIKFQEKYAQDTLAPWGLAKGTGYVGSTTRAKINEILGK